MTNPESDEFYEIVGRIEDAPSPPMQRRLDHLSYKEREIAQIKLSLVIFNKLLSPEEPAAFEKFVGDLATETGHSWSDVCSVLALLEERGLIIYNNLTFKLNTSKD